MKPRARSACSSAYRQVARTGSLTTNQWPSVPFPHEAIQFRLVAAHDKSVADARAALQAVNDTVLLTTNWKLRAGGQVVSETPRHIALRDMLNHLAHHRGQLTVYLRLLGAKVPAVYGPSADDQRFA